MRNWKRITIHIAGASLTLVGACADPELNNLTDPYTEGAYLTRAVNCALGICGATPGGGVAGGVGNLCETQGGKCLYVTTGLHNGNFASVAGASSGVNGADIFCQNNRPVELSGTYKALIVDGAVNRGATAGSQIDWVLVSGTSYFRYDDGAQVRVADANNQFSFPLLVSFSITAGEIWTGLANSWAAAASRCSTDWTVGTNANSGRVGNTVAVDSTAIDTGAVPVRSCDTLLSLLCVQQ